MDGQSIEQRKGGGQAPLFPQPGPPVPTARPWSPMVQRQGRTWLLSWDKMRSKTPGRGDHTLSLSYSSGI